MRGNLAEKSTPDILLLLSGTIPGKLAPEGEWIIHLAHKHRESKLKVVDWMHDHI
jgi:hypothetical protein